MNKIWNLYCGVSYELYNFSSATCVKSMIIFIIHCVGMAVLESDVLDDIRLQMFILCFVRIQLEVAEVQASMSEWWRVCGRRTVQMRSGIQGNRVSKS